MSDNASAALRELVRHRAGGRCEYCLLHEEDGFFPHEIDHVVARKHEGPTRKDNLAWSCFPCNNLKGSDLASIDPETGRVVRLFNPRRQRWSQHFRLDGAVILPLTPQGRATVNLLQLNHPERVRRREWLIQAGRYPR